MALKLKFLTNYHNILKTNPENRLRVWFIEHLKNPRFDNFTGLMPASAEETPGWISSSNSAAWIKKKVRKIINITGSVCAEY